MTWTYDPTMLTKILDHADYDVDDSQARGLGGGGSLSARRDRPNGTVLVAIDSGGRVKVTITRPLGVPGTEEATVDDMEIRLLIEETRAETIATELADTEQLSSLLDFVDKRIAVAPSQPEAAKDTPRRGARLLGEHKGE